MYIILVTMIYMVYILKALFKKNINENIYLKF